MSASRILPPGIPSSLRERFAALPPREQSDVLARLEAHRRARTGTRFVLVPLQARGTQRPDLTVPPTEKVRPTDARAEMRAPLVVMPSMFGAVGEWRAFFDQVTFDRPLYGLEMTGTEPFSATPISLDAIAAAAVVALRAQLPGQAVHLAGYSFGGRLAYEVGRQRLQEGEAPLSTTIVDASATSMAHRPRARDWVSIAANAPRWLQYQLSTRGLAAVGRSAFTRWRLLRTAPHGDAATLAELHRRFDFPRVPQAYHQRLTQNERAFRTYAPHPAALRVFYFHGRVHPFVHKHDPDGGWRRLVPADRLTSAPLPGNHLTAFQPGGREPLLSMLRRALADADHIAPAVRAPLSLPALDFVK